MWRIWNSIRTFWHNLDQHLTEGQQDTLRIVGWLAAAAALGAGGYFLGWPAIQRWQGRRAFAQAEVFANLKDYRSLAISLRRAVQKSPNDLATWHEAMTILDQIGSPMTVDALDQESKFDPDNTALRLALIQDALRFDRLDTAESALARLSADAWRDVAFHRLAASLAMALGNSAEYESQLAKVVGADPGDKNASFTLAALRLWGADEKAAEAARTEMEGLLSEPSVRIRAAIELVSYASSHRDAAGLRLLLGRLLDLFAPGTPPDFSVSDPPAWQALLKGMRSEAAAGSPADMALVARWEAETGRVDECLDWLQSLPPKTESNPLIRDTEAELAVRKGDLPLAQRLIAQGAWGQLPYEALTLAMAAHIQLAHTVPGRAHLTWIDAISACRGSGSGVRVLVRMAGAWRDTEDLEHSLEFSIRLNPKAFWAYNALRNSYAQRRNLPDLYRVYSYMVRNLPTDRPIAEEWIILACELDSGTPEIYANAETIYNADPHSPQAAVAYAASLWRQGRKIKASSVLSALAPDDLKSPANAFWVALVEADLGHRAAAGAALERAYSIGRAPQETALLNDAAKKAGYTVPGSN